MDVFIGYLLGKADLAHSILICRKSPKLNHFDIKCSETLNSRCTCILELCNRDKIKGFNRRLVKNSYLVLLTHSAAKFEQVPNTNACAYSAGANMPMPNAYAYSAGDADLVQIA